MGIDDLDNQAARLANAAGPFGPSDRRTRAVNIRNDKSISDIDWDID